MKNLICSVAVLITTVSSFGQAAPPHEWNATITVVNESGQAVPGAGVKAIFWTFTPQGERASTTISGLADSDGVFRVSSAYAGAPNILFRAAKVGFYNTARPYDLGDYYSVGRWNPEIKLVLKKVANPIAMYAKRVSLEAPAFEKPIGFDLMASDWVAPYGKGSSADIVFLSHYYNRRAKEDFDHQLIVTFSNAGDGIEPLAPIADEVGSELRSSHEAPTNGYEPKLIRTTSDHPGQTLVFDYDGNRAYFFRIRTVLDEKGQVKSALYGKIYGDFNSFCYYLNPTPNDRNIEFDPNQNFLPNQHVTAP